MSAGMNCMQATGLAPSPSIPACLAGPKPKPWIWDRWAAYQIFTTGGAPCGGMMTKMPQTPAPFWLYYFNVDSVEAAMARVKDAGGQIIRGPMQVPGGSWIAHGLDPHVQRARPLGGLRTSQNDQLAREKTLQAHHVRVQRGPDQDWAAGAILDQRDPAQDERPHDPLAELGFGDDDAAQALRGEMSSASTSVFARASNLTDTQAARDKRRLDLQRTERLLRPPVLLRELPKSGNPLAPRWPDQVPFPRQRCCCDPLCRIRWRSRACSDRC